MVDNHPGQTAGRFATTSWSRVLLAASDEADARPALSDLCQTYWYPLYAYLRRQGLSPIDAEDAVQAFFARLLESKLLRYVDPARGRFRGFLLASLRQFMAGRREYDSAARRKPPGAVQAIETGDGEFRYARELTDEVTPDRLYDYTWALSVLGRAMDALREESAARGTVGRFEAFQGLLTGQSDRPTREIADELGMTEGAVRVALFRLKQRFGELVRREVASTVDDDADVDEEIRVLMAALKMRGRA